MSIENKIYGVFNYNLIYNVLVFPPSHITCKTPNVLKNNMGAEIGVLFADTSSFLLDHIPSLTLYCVDPWAMYDGYKEKLSELDKVEILARSRLSKFKDRAIIYKDFSVNAAKNIEDEKLDFVFIDANHDYEFVKEDFRTWFPKVRVGGLMMGHDFTQGGVNKWINEFSKDNKDVDIFVSPFPSDVWYFVKTQNSYEGLL